MEHYIEDSIAVYLRFNFAEDRWVLDSATVDGAPLESNYHDGVERGNCACGDEDACYAAAEHAEQVMLPNADVLEQLLEETPRLDW